MVELLTWLEGSALGEAMRGMGVWTYGVLNLFHVIGIATLFGSIVVLDLRLLGLWRAVPLRMMATPTLPLATAGLTVAILSGVCMLATNAIDYIDNPFLLIKFPAIGLALINAAALSRVPAWRERHTREPSVVEHRQLAIAGGTSLVCWLAAISAGRMLGYW
ncbi:MAG: hypothetical protein GWN29_11455 [Gammaproteobacteria bacterium]|nr:hypothetical protein [Gammaproteobacteria bacterium]